MPVPVGFKLAVALGGMFNAAIAGRWSDSFVVPAVGVAATLLHTGKVLFWSYDPVDHHKSLINGLSAQIPSSSALVPPCHYMLLILDTAGIPSVARSVRVL